MWQPAAKCVRSPFFFSAELMNDREQGGQRNILRVLNLCVLFSNPVGLNLLWTFNMWPFLNPPYNFSFHFTLSEQQHFLCPACSSSSILSTFFAPVHGNNTSMLRAGRWSHLEQESMDGIWPGSLSLLCCFPPVIPGRRVESHQMSTSERHSFPSLILRRLFGRGDACNPPSSVLPLPRFAAWPRLSTPL